MKNTSILIVYNSEREEERELLNHIKASQSDQVQEWDIAHKYFNERNITDLANKLEIFPKELVRQHTIHDKQGENLTAEEVSNILKNEPEHMCTPISVHDGGAEFIDAGYAMINKTLALKK